MENDAVSAAIPVAVDRPNTQISSLVKVVLLYLPTGFVPAGVHSRYETRGALLLQLGAFTSAQDFDLPIHGGRLVDGTGNPAYVGDVAIRQGKIAAMGRLAGRTPRQVTRAPYLTPLWCWQGLRLWDCP